MIQPEDEGSVAYQPKQPIPPQQATPPPKQTTITPVAMPPSVAMITLTNDNALAPATVIAKNTGRITNSCYDYISRNCSVHKTSDRMILP